MVTYWSLIRICKKKTSDIAHFILWPSVCRTITNTLTNTLTDSSEINIDVAIAIMALTLCSQSVFLVMQYYLPYICKQKGNTISLKVVLHGCFYFAFSFRVYPEFLSLEQSFLKT